MQNAWTGCLNKIGIAGKQRFCFMGRYGKTGMRK